MKCRATVKSVLAQCVVCKRHKVMPYLFVQSSLPEWRVTKHAPLKAIGVNFAGPFFEKEGRAHVLLFMCVSVRALHCEVTVNVSTDSVINAFR